MKSIMQKDKCCYICGTERGLHLHHCLHGTANRKLADRDGLTVYLCAEHHRRVHAINDMDLSLKQFAEEAYLEHYGKTIKDFVARYGKNYLDL